MCVAGGATVGGGGGGAVAGAAVGGGVVVVGGAVVDGALPRVAVTTPVDCGEVVTTTTVAMLARATMLRIVAKRRARLISLSFRRFE